MIESNLWVNYHFTKYILRHRVQYQVVLNVFSSVLLNDYALKINNLQYLLAYKKKDNKMHKDE